jgi:hypothetical protein
LQRDWKDQIAISESLEKQNLDAARESDDKADDLMDKAGHMGCSWAL